MNTNPQPVRRNWMTRITPSHAGPLVPLDPHPGPSAQVTQGLDALGRMARQTPQRPAPEKGASRTQWATPEHLRPPGDPPGPTPIRSLEEQVQDLAREVEVLREGYARLWTDHAALVETTESLLGEAHSPVDLDALPTIPEPVPEATAEVDFGRGQAASTNVALESTETVSTSSVLEENPSTLSDALPSVPEEVEAEHAAE